MAGTLAMKDAMAQAGGFNQFANRSKIVILRPNGKTMTRIPFNYNKVIASGGEDENFYLQAGDIVLVPAGESRARKVSAIPERSKSAR